MLSAVEVAKVFNVNPNTVRNWEHKGLIKPDMITPSGRKFYSEEQIKLLSQGGLKVAK